MFKRDKKSDAGNGPFGGFAASARQAGRTPDQVLDEFNRMPLPDAIDGIIFRASMADPSDPHALSGFERYAARAFGEVDSAALRSIAIEHPLEARFLGTTKLFWIHFDRTSISEEKRAIILHAESVLNRLTLVGRSIDANADEIACSRVDWGLFRTVADDARDLIDSSSKRATRTENYHGAKATPGGNWDVLIRFATVCESSVLPFRLEYQHDCDAASGAFAADITLPAPSFFPRSRWDDAQNRWVDASAEQASAAAAYDLRLITRIAAIAFGSSLGILTAVISGHEVSLDSSSTVSFEFSRAAFLTDTVPRVNAGSFSDPRFTSDPATMFSLLRPTRWALSPDADGRSKPIDKIKAALPATRIPLAQDTRPLPSAMAALLHADRVCDLDVMSAQDADLAARVHAAAADRADAPLLACAQLEEIVAKADEKTPEDGLTELYCDGMFARMLVSLVETDPDVRYSRASDSVQQARSALAELYTDLGDHDGAIAQARKCLSIAPTSPDSHLDVINACAAAERYEDVVGVAKKALAVAVTDQSVSYLYYRLAYAFWRTGRIDEAIACYTRVSQGHNIFDVAQQELAELLREAGRAHAFDRPEAESVLRAAGVPLAPTDAALSVLAEVAIACTDAGIPLAASPAAALVGSVDHDDIIMGVSTSLRRGA